jgi:hypothetical protein
MNFGCKEIEIVAAVGGLLKVLRYDSYHTPHYLA